MALPNNADVIVFFGYWFDEVTQAGVRANNNQPATVTFDPVPLSGVSSTRTPNLRDLVSQAWLKTRQRVAIVDETTGYFAVKALSSNDPDLDAYGGRKVTFLGEDPFTVEVPYNAPLVTVSAAMSAATGLTQGTQVRAMALAEAALVTTPTAQPALSYLTSTQTLSTIASGIEAHNEFDSAHADIRAEIDALSVPTLDADLTAIAALDSATAGAIASDGSGWIKKTYAQLKTALGLVKADVGLGSVDNTADTAKPVSTAQQAALDVARKRSVALALIL